MDAEKYPDGFVLGGGAPSAQDTADAAAGEQVLLRSLYFRIALLTYCSSSSSLYLLFVKWLSLLTVRHMRSRCGGARGGRVHLGEFGE